jgi:hypothetical protein
MPDLHHKSWLQGAASSSDGAFPFSVPPSGSPESVKKQTARRAHKVGMDVPCENCHKQTAFLVSITAPEGGYLRIYRCLSCNRFTWVKEASEGPRSGSPESNDQSSSGRG